MAISNYTELKSALDDFLGGRSDVPWDTIIVMLEAHLNRILVHRRMTTTTTLSTVAGTRSVALPTDMVEIEALTVQRDPRVLLDFVTSSQLETDYPFNTSGTPAVYTIIGTDLRFAPTPDAVYSVECIYKQQLPSLTANATNWLLTYHPDVYMYGALTLTAPYLRNDERITVWASYFERALEGVASENDRAQYNGGPLTSRVDVYVA